MRSTPDALRMSAIALFAVLAAACSSTGGGGGGGSPDMITREQIETLPEGSAFTVVQRLRRSWLRARTQATFGNSEPAYPVVFLDEMRFGDIDSLNRISTNQIQSIQYISAVDATTRYGTGYMGGIIRINTVSTPG